MHRDAEQTRAPERDERPHAVRDGVASECHLGVRIAGEQATT